ncbi:MAG: ABC transporter ATP-binding protein [Candidatus Woesearchaeota archaeon]
MRKTFGKEIVLRDASLTLYRGEILGLIGKSGSGKTTLLRILMGFYKPNSGTIWYDGKDITQQTQKIRHSVGLTTQESSFYDRLNVQENLWHYGRMYHISKKELEKQVPRLLQLVDLEDHKKTLAKDLSGGMRRRLDFAISLIHDPDILILDEPTTGLDPSLRKSMWKLIWQIQSLGKTILITSHHFEELEEHCTRIAILESGYVRSVAPMDWYFKKYPQCKNLTQIFEVYTR